MKKKVVVTLAFFLSTLDIGLMKSNLHRQIGFLCAVVAMVTWSMPDVTAALLLLAIILGNYLEFESPAPITTAARVAKTNEEQLKATPNPRIKSMANDTTPPQETTIKEKSASVDTDILPWSDAELLDATARKVEGFQKNTMRRMHPSARAFAEILDEHFRQLPPNTENGFLVPDQPKDAS